MGVASFSTSRLEATLKIRNVIHQYIPINRKAEAPLRLCQLIQEMYPVGIDLEQIAPFRPTTYDVVYAIRKFNSFRSRRAGNQSNQRTPLNVEC